MTPATAPKEFRPKERTMKYVAFFALTLLTGCAVSPPDNTLAYRSGAGVVEGVQQARVALPPPRGGAIAGSEAAGGSHGSPMERLFRPRWTEGYQLTLKMDDGTSQRITQDGADFKVGDRVQVTPQGHVIKSTAAAAPPPAVGAAPAAPAPASPAPPISATPLPPVPGQAVAPGRTYRPGIGVVESASVVSLSSSSSAAAGGASGPTMAYRLKMLDGTTQDVVQAGQRFRVGDRVQITREGQVALP
jgi:hypothetical protein